MLRSDALRRALCWLIALYIRLVYATSRWTVEGAELPRRHHREGRPFILAFWHGRLLMMPMAWQQGVPIHMLISNHRDGRIIADAVRHFGIASIAGSSSRGGGAALRRMVKALREGECVGITPDGPRGPGMIASPGIVATARLARVPIIPLAYATRRRRILRTWDRFHLPVPFTQGIHLWGETIDVPGDADEAMLETYRRLVEDRLNALGAEADRRMGHAGGVPTTSLSLALYRALATLLGPLVRLFLVLRRRRGKEDAARLRERLGRASAPRPPGPLLWLHAASVGEAASLLALIDRLAAERPDLSMLVTTGTVTSARLLAQRLPGGRALHQFVPVDRPAYARRFLDHWRPDLAIWVESELWPNLVAATQARGIATVLLNGRMSERSFARWRRWRGLIGPLLGGMSLCLAQDATQRDRLRVLGAATTETVGDLKAAAPPLPFNETDLARLAGAIGGRPFWLAASTHPGEEEVAARVHRRLQAAHPEILTLLVPRHPVRAGEIRALLEREGLTVAQRSRGEAIDAATHIYLGDTMGEMGLFYRLAEIVFLGGSLAPVGGHNPLEPALLGCAILHGPDTSNCAATTRALEEAGGARSIADAEELAAEVDRLLRDAPERQRMAEAARGAAARQGGVLDEILARLAPHLDRICPAACGAENDRACA